MSIPAKLQVSHFGLPRAEGEKSDDAIRVLQRDDSLIAALADGLGSSRQGGEAAQRAVAMIVDYFHARPQAWSPRRALSEFVQQINQVLHQESLQQHGSPELLCTLSVVVLEGGMLYGLNVGDSPVFLWRKGTLRQLSQNHVVSRQGMEHVLTQAVGLARELAPTVFEVPIEDGDMLLLCSDGVSNAISGDKLCEALSKRPSARALVRAATDTWHDHPELRDDVSAVVIDLAEGGFARPHAMRELEVIGALEAGDRHDNFKLVRALNQGGRLWLAEDDGGPLHVLKFPPPEAAEDEGRRDAFMREVWHSTRVESLDFVRAHAPGGGSLRYFVIEYVDAPTLRDTLRGGRLRVEEALELAKFLLRVAQYLLLRDHVHGDLRPENILVLRKAAIPEFRMIDFGCSAGAYVEEGHAGRPSYLAPERFEGAAVSERTEVFSIGMILYEALTGILPYGIITHDQCFGFDRAAKRARRCNHHVPVWLDHVVQRALSVDVALRYESFSKMAFDLENPERVVAFKAQGERGVSWNPLTVFKFLSLLLFLGNLVFLWLWLRS